MSYHKLPAKQKKNWLKDQIFFILLVIRCYLGQLAIFAGSSCVTPIILGIY